MPVTVSPKIPSINLTMITGPLSPVFLLTGQEPITRDTKLSFPLTRCIFVIFFLLRMVVSGYYDVTLFPGENLLMTISDGLLYVFPIIQCLYLFARRKSIQLFLLNLVQRVIQCRKQLNHKLQNQIDAVAVSSPTPTSSDVEVKADKHITLYKFIWPLCLIYITSILPMLVANVILILSYPPYRHRFLPSVILNNPSLLICNYVIMFISTTHEVLVYEFIPLTLFLYLFLFAWLHEYKLHSIKKILQLASNHPIYSIEPQLTDLEATQRNFDNLFSFLPFLWFSHNFCVGLTFLFQVAINPTVYDNLITSYCAAFSITYNQILTFGAVLIISFYQDSLVSNEVSTYLLKLLEKKSTSPHDFILYHRMKQFLTDKLTVWHFFSIENSLIISFVGSALSFSVLLFQLSSKGFK